MSSSGTDWRQPSIIPAVYLATREAGQQRSPREVDLPRGCLHRLTAIFAGSGAVRDRSCSARQRHPLFLADEWLTRGAKTARFGYPATKLARKNSVMTHQRRQVGAALDDEAGLAGKKAAGMFAEKSERNTRCSCPSVANIRYQTRHKLFRINRRRFSLGMRFSYAS